MVIIIVGVIISLIGIGAFLNPNFAKLINVPGGSRLKAMVALIVGLIILIYGLIS